MNNMEIKVSVKDIPEVIEQLQQAEKKINNLQSKIDKAIEWIEQYEKQIGILGETSKSIVLTDDVVIGNLLDILKEDK